MPLEIERAHYETIQDQLLKEHPGKFALVIGAELLGVYDSPDEAYNQGVEQRGNVPMLIMRVQDDDPTETAPALMLGLVSAST